MPDVATAPNPQNLTFCDRKKASIAGIEGNRRRWQRYRNQQALQKALKIAARASPDEQPSALRMSRALIEAKLQLPDIDPGTTETLARAVDRLTSAECRLAAMAREEQRGRRGPNAGGSSGSTPGQSPARSYGRLEPRTPGQAGGAACGPPAK